MTQRALPAAKLLAERIAARLGLALTLAFAAAVLPTVVHSLFTGGPMEAAENFVTLTRWIFNDFTPDLPDLSDFSVVKG